ncbi:MAG: glucose-6-phosphate isomerase [Chloroflexota bacterium]
MSQLTTTLGINNVDNYQADIDAAITAAQDGSIVSRIWDHDHTVWRPDPTEITNRLGWLHSPVNMRENIAGITALVDAVKSDGYERVVALGMGGSSLAPEVFQKVYGKPAGPDNDYLAVTIFDSTDPDMLRDLESNIELSKTLIIVATKSGGTVETLSGFKYFYNRIVDTLGAENAGQHFVAITDPGSRLEDIAQKFNFRETFLNDPNIGGRYAALSYYGMVAAGLVGVDMATLLDRAAVMSCNNASQGAGKDTENLGTKIGIIMGVLAKAGRDKITFIASPAIESFGDWVEQLIAESTGKEGKGILPVVGEAVGSPDVYRDDRLFVHLRLPENNADPHDAAVQSLIDAGQPVLTLTLTDLYDLGGQFFLWEVATAIASHVIDIQPFDQPNVESAKVLARQMVAEYMEKGELPAGETAPLTAASLETFLAQAKAGDYISIHAYVNPTAEANAAVNELRLALRDKLKLASTVGYGPRFLHSTGQLHKGDGGNGLFIQFTTDAIEDVDIPDEAGETASTMSFGVLKNSQALGDAQALLGEGRRVIRFNLGQDVVGGVASLTESLGS